MPSCARASASTICALVIGAGMGGMHTWMWGERYPGFMDALLPLASTPAQIAGRSRMYRDMIVDALRSDPARGALTAQYIAFLMNSSALQLEKLAPTRDVADAQFQTFRRRAPRHGGPHRPAVSVRRLAQLRRIAGSRKDPGARRWP